MSLNEAVRGSVVLLVIGDVACPAQVSRTSGARIWVDVPDAEELKFVKSTGREYGGGPARIEPFDGEYQFDTLLQPEHKVEKAKKQKRGSAGSLADVVGGIMVAVAKDRLERLASFPDVPASTVADARKLVKSGGGEVIRLNRLAALRPVGKGRDKAKKINARGGQPLYEIPCRAPGGVDVTVHLQPGSAGVGRVSAYSKDVAWQIW